MFKEGKKPFPVPHSCPPIQRGGLQHTRRGISNGHLTGLERASTSAPAPAVNLEKKPGRGGWSGSSPPPPARRRLRSEREAWGGRGTRGVGRDCRPLPGSRRWVAAPVWGIHAEEPVDAHLPVMVASLAQEMRWEKQGKTQHISECHCRSQAG